MNRTETTCVSQSLKYCVIFTEKKILIYSLDTYKEKKMEYIFQLLLFVNQHRLFKSKTDFLLFIIQLHSFIAFYRLFYAKDTIMYRVNVNHKVFMIIIYTE